MPYNAVIIQMHAIRYLKTSRYELMYSSWIDQLIVCKNFYSIFDVLSLSIAKGCQFLLPLDYWWATIIILRYFLLWFQDFLRQKNVFLCDLYLRVDLGLPSGLHLSSEHSVKTNTLCKFATSFGNCYTMKDQSIQYIMTITCTITCTWSQ